MNLPGLYVSSPTSIRMIKIHYFYFVVNVLTGSKVSSGKAYPQTFVIRAISLFTGYIGAFIKYG